MSDVHYFTEKYDVKRVVIAVVARVRNTEVQVMSSKITAETGSGMLHYL